MGQDLLDIQYALLNFRNVKVLIIFYAKDVYNLNLRGGDARVLTALINQISLFYSASAKVSIQEKNYQGRAKQKQGSNCPPPPPI